MSKPCFKCRSVLPLSSFYKHPEMTDGHLGKCKACTKKDVRANRITNAETLREYERRRSKLPERKRYQSRHQSDWRKRSPIKLRAHRLVRNAIRSGMLHVQSCMLCGQKAHAHHDDYSKPLEVIWLCPKHHKERHRELDAAREIPPAS